jgi:hypothetical protein
MQQNLHKESYWKRVNANLTNNTLHTTMNNFPRLAFIWLSFSKVWQFLPSLTLVSGYRLKKSLLNGDVCERR